MITGYPPHRPQLLSKNVFERELNDKPAPPLDRTGTPIRTKNYGAWLRRYDPTEFQRQYEQWRSAQ